MAFGEPLPVSAIWGCELFFVSRGVVRNCHAQFIYLSAPFFQRRSVYTYVWFGIRYFCTLYMCIYSPLLKIAKIPGTLLPRTLFPQVPFPQEPKNLSEGGKLDICYMFPLKQKQLLPFLSEKKKSNT